MIVGMVNTDKFPLLSSVSLYIYLLETTGSHRSMEMSLTRYIAHRVCGAALQYFLACSLWVQDDINGALCGALTLFVVLFDFEAASNLKPKRSRLNLRGGLSIRFNSTDKPRNTVNPQ